MSTWIPETMFKEHIFSVRLHGVALCLFKTKDCKHLSRTRGYWCHSRSILSCLIYGRKNTRMQGEITHSHGTI